MPRPNEETSRAIRVAQLTPTYFSDDSVIGGGERYVTNVVRALDTAARAQGRELDICIVSTGAREMSDRSDGWPVQVLRDINGGLPMDAVPEGLRRQLRGVDLVHVHQGFTGFGAAVTAICAQEGVPFVLTDLGGGHHGAVLDAGGVGFAAGIISISRFASTIIGRPAAFDEVVLGPVDTDFFTPDPTVVRDPELVVCVGRLLPHKGVDRIIRALPRGMRLQVFGRPYDDRYLSDLRQLARGKRVEFHEDAGDETVRAAYRRAAVFVHASTHRDLYGHSVEKPELMGLTTIEALSCGAPVLVSNAGSLPELVEGAEGFSDVFRDDAELEALLLGVHGGVFGSETSLRAREFAVRRYAMGVVGARLLAAYDRALEAGR
ncbi:MAG: glycosyltransferase family 4 protein [Protaetiibacter sp.]